jgi:hypothetical protein
MDSSSQLEGLDQESRDFAERLFAVFHRWRAFASIKKSEAGTSFHVEVPSPTGDSSRGLQIWLEDSVPSAAFGEWHTHADLFASEADFLTFLEEIVADRQLFLFVSTWAARWSVVDEPINEAVEDALIGESAPDVLQVISWSGKKDRTVRRSDL